VAAVAGMVLIPGSANAAPAAAKVYTTSNLTRRFYTFGVDKQQEISATVYFQVYTTYSATQI
jgi:hypothetical protein